MAESIVAPTSVRTAADRRPADGRFRRPRVAPRAPADRSAWPVARRPTGPGGFRRTRSLRPA